MKKLFKRLRIENGAITVMTAVMLTVVIGFTALAIDLGLHYYRGARLQNAVDAAATAVAGNLGSIDTSLEDVAYEYLERNGFDKEKYGTDSNGDSKLKVTIEKKGEVDLESVDDERYIKAGYYKITVSAVDDTLLAKVLNIQSLRLVKTSYVKAEANYVPMPRALNYTIFAGSTKGNNASPAMQLNGRTSVVFNRAVGLVESGINLINSAIVQPLIGFFGGNANYNDLVHINVSEIVSNGDLHSNSNISVKVQALNMSRVKDRDFEGNENVEAYEHLEVEEDEIESGFNDYGQVTATAVDDIKFNKSESFLFGFANATPYSDSKTRIYVANQQYIEQTQQALNVIDLLDFSQINSTPALREKYEYAAQVYTSKIFNLTDEQKAAIINQKDNLEYVGNNEYKLNNQGGIIYYIHASDAENALAYAREKGIDGLVEDLNRDGNDKMFSSDSETPLYSGYADNKSSTSSVVNFTKKDEHGDTTDSAKININGSSIARDFGKVSNINSNTNASRTGMRFAVARTFMENSEYIPVPNLKPYFTRQVNRSIRNATKSREKINQSDAGYRTVKLAVKAKTQELTGYLENLSFEDLKYNDVDTYTSYDNTVLFKRFKSGSETGLTDLKNNTVSYTGSLMNYNYNVTMSDKTYKGYSLYNANNVLKSPAEFVNEYKLLNESSSGSEAIQNKKKAITDAEHNNANSEETAVTRMKDELLNNKNFKYDYEKSDSSNSNNVKKRIESIQKPDITMHAGVVNPKVTVTAPSEPDVFLGYGTTGNGTTIPRTSGPRKAFDNFVKGYGVSVSTDTFTAPAQPSIGNAPSGGSGTLGGNNCRSDQYTTAGKIYSSATTPYYTEWFNTHRFNMICNNNSAITGDVKVDNGIGLYVQNGGNLRVGGKFYTDGGSNCTLQTESGGKLYVHGMADCQHGGTTINCSGYTHIGGKIYLNAENQKINVYNGGKLYVNGNVECNDQKDELNVWGYCQINGDLKTVKVNGSGNREFKVNVKSGGVLVVKGSIDFTYKDYITVESGGTLIVQNQCTVNNSGSITVNGNLIQLNGSNSVDTSSLSISGGKLYTVGGINSKAAITVDNSSVYCLTNVSANNDNSSSDYLDIKGTSNIYIRGVLTTGGNKKHLYIHDGTNSVVSILGEGAADCFNGTCSQIHANNSTSGNKVYLGKSTTIYDNNENIVNGGLSCFGNLTFNSNSQITLTGNGLSYITGNLNATSASIFNVSNNQVLYVLGNINTTNLTVDNAKVHANGRIDISQLLKLINGGLLEGVSGVGATSYDTAGGDFNSVKTISFDVQDISANAMADGYVKTESVSARSMTLDNVKLKIEGNLTLTGDLILRNGSVLYVTGSISCAAINLNNSQLYVDDNISCSSINMNRALILTRKGNVVNLLNSNLSCTGAVTASDNSKIYVEGAMTAKSVNVSGSTEVLGYKSLNLTETYSSSGAGSITISGSNSEVFCGPSSTSSSSKWIYIVAGGKFYYPAGLYSCHMEVKTGGKVVIDGSQNNQSCEIKDYALVESAGIFFNKGLTKITNCRFTNNGMMYLVGGVNSSGINSGSGDQDFILGNNSESYIGKTSSANLSTLNYKGWYEGRGNVYIENNLVIAGSTSSVTVNKRNVSCYIGNGTTYVLGGVTCSNGNAIKTEANTGLIMNNDLNIACPIYNFGKLHVINGSLKIDTTQVYLTDGELRNSTLGIYSGDPKWENNRKNCSLKNGDGEGSVNAEFFVGGTYPIHFIGFVRNAGKIYFNSSVNIEGYGSIDGMNDDFAYVNYAGAQTHINGAVKLNSNQLFNKWKSGNNECIFACEGKLTYGGCLTNCGKVFVDGAVTNNESNSETVNGKKYLSKSFSVMNGMYVIDKDTVKDNFNSMVYPAATLYCSGKMEVGVSEAGGESGAIISIGTMYVGGDMNIFTNGPYLKIAITDLFSNSGSHSYFRTGLWLLNNSNTFVGGNSFVGAGAAIGRDSIFMTGGDFRVKRSLKLNCYMFMDKTTGVGYHLNHDDTATTYGTNTPYNSSYMYVGGTAFINTIGSTTSSSTMSALIGVHRYPQNCTRDTDIYANSNVYIGGWWYNNAKLYIKENCSIMVAGKGDGFYKSNGQLSNLIYQPTGDLVVPEKQLTNGVAVLTYLYSEKNKHQPCKLYIYQSLDISPCASLIVHGGGKVRDTAKIRDMTKTYFYGDFDADEYLEIGKATDGADETEAKEPGFIQAGENLTNYEFSNSAYMYVGGDVTSGSSGVLSSLFNGKIFQIFKEAFFSTGYTKVYASATLKAKGAVTSNKYITLRHDARIYSGGDMTAKTSIDGGNYSEFYVGGSMTAGSSALTTIIDSLDILDLSNRGTINLREQVRCIVGGDMFSTKHIHIGELAAGSYTRGRKTNYGVSSVTEGSEGQYNSEDITEKVCPNSKCGQPLDESELQNHHCNDCGNDFDPSQFDAGSDENGNQETIDDAQIIDTSTDLDEVEDDAYGANVFIQGSMVALNGHIKEFAYSSIVVGKYVYCPDNIEIRSNADLWVMPETFGNSTYQYLPYSGSAGDTIFSKILYYIRKAGYEARQALMAHDGSVYTLSQLILYKNASLMGTYDCVVPGQCVLSHDSLVYFGHDFTCTAPSLDIKNGAINLFNMTKNAINGWLNPGAAQSETDKPIAGFDARGIAGPGYRYTCKNTAAHNGYYYHMTTRKDEQITGTLVCDVCGQPINTNTRKLVQVSYPAVVYANNKINIITTVSMQMTYLIANRSDVNLYNVATVNKYNESNLKELPNAISSYLGNINYFAMYGKLASLFYAPTKNVDFDGYYSEIWGCVLGDTVTMNCYYQAFHRFNNWRTMNLNIAESGSVYIIPESTYIEAPDNVDSDNFLNDTGLNPNLPEGAQIFFD